MIARTGVRSLLVRQVFAELCRFFSFESAGWCFKWLVLFVSIICGSHLLVFERLESFFKFFQIELLRLIVELGELEGS